MSIRLVLEGRVCTADTDGPLAGVVVRAFLGRTNRAVGSSVTNGLGAFTLTIDAVRQAVLESGAALTFAVYAADSRQSFYRSGPVRLNRWPKQGLRIAIAESALDKAFAKPLLTLLADGSRVRRIEVGQTLLIAGSHFCPSTVHDITLSLGAKALSKLTLATDPFGVLPATAIAPQLGLAAFDSAETFTLKQALEKFGGRTLTVDVAYRGTSVAKARITIDRRSSRPLGFVSDAKGRIRNWIQHDEDDLHLTLANVARSSYPRVPRRAAR
jgi:hypothetical protein